MNQFMRIKQEVVQIPLTTLNNGLLKNEAKALGSPLVVGCGIAH